MHLSICPICIKKSSGEYSSGPPSPSAKKSYPNWQKKTSPWGGVGKATRLKTCFRWQPIIGSVTRAVSDEWKLNAWQRGSIVSMVFIGVCLGNLLSGKVGYVASHGNILIYSICINFDSYEFRWNYMDLCGFVWILFELILICINFDFTSIHTDSQWFV